MLSCDNINNKKVKSEKKQKVEQKKNSTVSIVVTLADASQAPETNMRESRATDRLMTSPV